MVEGAQITREQVLEKLKEVYDPEIPISVVDLGLIYDIQINGTNEVYVRMTLTTPGCGMGPYIAQQAEWSIAELEGVEDVTVELTFDPPWTLDMLTEEGKKLLGL